MNAKEKFQSTHSLRSATYLFELHKLFHVVSIHALLAECDRLKLSLAASLVQFQSTHSLRSATAYTQVPRTGEVVSIHALLAECDYNARKAFNIADVSIHALLAECDSFGIVKCKCSMWFQSTHSLRSATGP